MYICLLWQKTYHHEVLMEESLHKPRYICLNQIAKCFIDFILTESGPKLCCFILLPIGERPLICKAVQTGCKGGGKLLPVMKKFHNMKLTLKLKLKRVTSSYHVTTGCNMVK